VVATLWAGARAVAGMVDSETKKREFPVAAWARWGVVGRGAPWEEDGGARESAREDTRGLSCAWSTKMGDGA
jgi:hypothetical protein